MLSDNGHKGKIVPRNSGLSAPSYQRRHRLEITVLAHNMALHYLANHHPLTADERTQLTEVVHGYTGPCDVIAAREAWLGCASAIASGANGRRFGAC